MNSIPFRGEEQRCTQKDSDAQKSARLWKENRWWVWGHAPENIFTALGPCWDHRGVWCFLTGGRSRWLQAEESPELRLPFLTQLSLQQ